MKKSILAILLLFALFIFGGTTYRKNLTQEKPGLKIIFIRHGEKPEKGGNLTCKGLNRSLQIPSVIARKFGVPDFTYVPQIATGDKTSHARMFETVTPLAVKYNLVINSKFDEKDFAGVAAELKSKTGTVLVVWEHSAIPGIIQALGVKDEVKWQGDDFDSIWIVTIKNGNATFSTDKEGLNPSNDCP